MREETQTQAVVVSSVLQDLETPRVSVFNPKDQEMRGSLGHFQLLLSKGCCYANTCCAEDSGVQCNGLDMEMELLRNMLAS